MSSYLSTCARAGARLLGAGALATTLLAAGPMTQADAATDAATGAASTTASLKTASLKTAVKTAAKRKTKAQRAAERRRAHRKRVARKIGYAVKVARQQKGDPYRYGAAGPNAFDCSGLMQYAFSKAGLRLPRTSDAQAGAVRKISRKAMRPGDLVFFHRGGDVYHVGVFTKRRHGATWIIHAPYGSKPVQGAKVWTDSWFPGTLRAR